MVKKIGYKKKRNYKKRSYPKRIPRNMAPKNVHYFKRSVVIGDLSKGSGTAAYLNAYQFQLNDLPNYSEFTALYDFYKICAIKIRIIPGWTVGNVDVNTGAPVSAQVNLASARIFSAIDYNDSSNPSTVNEIREYGNCKMSPFLKGHKRYFKPQAQDSSLSYAIPRKLWIDTNTPSRAYYGLKLGIDFNGYSFLSTTIVGKIEAVYYIKCKAIR